MHSAKFWIKLFNSCYKNDASIIWDFENKAILVLFLIYLSMGLLSFNYCVSELDVFAFRKKNDNDYAGKHAGFLYPEAGASFIHLFSSSSPLYFYFCLKNSSFYFLDIVCRGPSEQQSLRPHAYWNSQVFFFFFSCEVAGLSLALDFGHPQLDQLHWLHK